jgi:uncharacterized protein (DUF2062 family)
MALCLEMCLEEAGGFSGLHGPILHRPEAHRQEGDYSRPVLRRWWKRVRQLWELAKREHATPHQIGWAVGIGAFCGCTPAVGFHGWVAVGAATILRLNRLWAWIGSRISNIVVLPFIVWAEIEIAHWLRTGQTVVLDRHTILKEAHLLLLDWCLGTPIVGVALGLTCGLIAYGISRFRRKPAPDPSLSSGSPPSDSTAHPS